MLIDLIEIMANAMHSGSSA